jgi:hypothetical protein
MKVLVVLALAILASGSSAWRPSHPEAISRQGALVPPSILWGIAATESDFRAGVSSPDGRDRGMFQLRRDFDAERGVVNPFDPVESAGHAARILAADFAALKCWDMAITAYKWGRTGAQKHGVDRAYVTKVTDALPPNLLEGHEVDIQLPDMVLVTTDALAGITWSGPMILNIDGRPSAKITLPEVSAAFPRRPIWPYIAAGGLGILLGGWAGASIAHALQ